MTTDSQTITSYTQGAEDYNKIQPTSFYHKYVEKPAMFSLLPDLNGKRVLCIGVGTGHEANALKLKGSEVIGIDISEGMINHAKKNFPDMEFLVKDMNKLDFLDLSFDFVYSSLAFHYTDDLDSLFKNIWRILKPEGQLLFSTTHPVFDSTIQFYEGNKRFNVIGHSKNQETQEVETLGDYFTEEKRTQDWGNNFIVNFHHKTLTTWITSVINSGFIIKRFVEPKPLKEAQELFPERYKIYVKRPGYIIMLCEKVSN